MSAANRATLIRKTQRTLREAFPKVQLPIKDRPLLEHILYACCLENSTPDQASEAFSKLQTLYVGWNEVRVTTNAELAEVMDCLTDPSATAHRVRRTLYNIYETHYDFDIDFLIKENLGKTQKLIKTYQGKAKGLLDFTIAYVTQNGLGGHAIPLNEGALDALLILGIVTPRDRRYKKVPGLERTISKNKGAEFGALLHLLSAELTSDPYGKKIRELLLKINPKCEDNLPQEPVPPSDLPEEETVEPVVTPETVKTAKKPAAKKSATKKPAAKKPAKKATRRKSSAASKPGKKSAKRKSK